MVFIVAGKKHVTDQCQLANIMCFIQFVVSSSGFFPSIFSISALLTKMFRLQDFKYIQSSEKLYSLAVTKRSWDQVF